MFYEFGTHKISTHRALKHPFIIWFLLQIFGKHYWIRHKMKRIFPLTRIRKSKMLNVSATSNSYMLMLVYGDSLFKTWLLISYETIKNRAMSGNFIFHTQPMIDSLRMCVCACVCKCLHLGTSDKS